MLSVRVKVRAVLVTAVVAALVTCCGSAMAAGGDETVAFQGDVGHTGALTGMHLTPPLMQAWSYAFSAEVSDPLVAGGAVYVTGVPNGSSYPEVVAFSQATGAILWSHSFTDTYYAGRPAYDAGRVFVVDPSGTAPTLTAFDAATGAIDWSYRLPFQFSSNQPVARDGVVYVEGAMIDGFLNAISESTGTLLWTGSIEGDAGPPAMDANGVYVANAANYFAFDLATGGLRWHDFKGSYGTGQYAPVAADGHVFIRDTAVPNAIYSAGDGSSQGALPASAAPVISDGIAYELDHSSLDAYADDGLGAATWSAPFTGDGRLDSAPLLVGSTLFVGSGSGELYALDAQTGQPVWSTQTGGSIPGDLYGASTANGDVGMGAGDDSLVVGSGDSLVDYVDSGAPAGAPGSENPPSVEGLSSPGEQLAADVGSWSGQPTSFTYKWLRCDRSGANCDEIPGATSATYPVTVADEDAAVEVQMTASNASGDSDPATSAPVQVQTPVAPAEVSPPASIGSGYALDPETAAAGVWTGDPHSFAYQWSQCAKDGTQCAPISGAESAIYTPQVADIGCTLTVTVTATGDGGTGQPATSGIVGPIKRPTLMTPPATTDCGAQPTNGGGMPRPGPTAPSNYFAATLSGTPVVGSELEVDPGRWAGTAPITYIYQWLRCDDSGCTPIAGANAFDYAIGSDDIGSQLKFTITATNSGGTTVVDLGLTAAVPAPSAPDADAQLATGTAPAQAAASTMAPVAATPAPADTPTTPSATAQSPATTSAEVAMVRHAVGAAAAASAMTGGHAAPLTVTAPVAGHLVMSWFYVASGSRRRVLLASARLVFSHAGRRAVKLHLTAGGARTIRRQRRGGAVLVLAEFQPLHGRAVVARRTFRLRA